GETHGNVEQRVQQQGHELNVKLDIVWQGGVVANRGGIDKLIHKYLKEQGCLVQQFDDTGRDTEWIKCTVGELEKALNVIKEQLYQDELKRQVLGDKFYLELRNWYYWANSNFPDPDTALRIIIRLLFCYFLREKELVPKELFEERFIKEHLKENEEYRYYNAILRNLFFHCLNMPIIERHDIEHKKLIKNVRHVKEQFIKIPFLNGGLFDELEGDEIPLSNRYFFDEEATYDLSELGGSYKVAGIVRILSQYQYKLSLDDVLDREEYVETVDPEFIGKVFESLLACIDADSNATRRKITGSFYTPREVVDYMVNEALDAYLAGTPVLKTADSRRQTAAEVDTERLLYCKILDPACGSGAFPSGIMNEILRRIDPPASERYCTKLKIIQQVIYGVDIQPIAVQISQLRLFLSLIQEIIPDKRKDNCGILPLPNLETKFVCADTLIGLKKTEKNGQRLLQSPKVTETIQDLQSLRRDYFMANTVQEKERLRKYDATLRRILADLMEGAFTHDASEKLMAWNPYNQSQSSPFFDSVWMFGVEKFDIVIGNPPYGAVYPAEHKEYFQQKYDSAKTTDIIVKGNVVGKLKGSLDTFSLFIENGFNSLKTNGYLMFIVPLSVISSDSMTALLDILEKNCSVITVASLCDRPQQIFHLSHKKTAIIGFWKDHQRNKRILSTQMYRKDKETPLKDLLKRFKFINVAGLGLRGRYAKISQPIEKRILKKLRNESHVRIRDLIDENGKPIYYRAAGGMYYNVITNYPSDSTQEKSLLFDKKIANAVGAALSSSLFWWYQQVYSDNLHIKSYEIESFPIPVKRLTPAVRQKIETLYKKYLRDIERHVIEHETTEYKHVTKYKEYKIRYSKALIDAMDDIICPLYGLTKEECEFIKNYELDFRMRGE
ncbi:MAG: N-6 DNA methylase, partial [Planctomycetaceae bacterium]|nr:N-6 DNA methylase [Planctomycetaceae bacterium]